MGGHEQGVLHKTINIHLKCSIFKCNLLPPAPKVEILSSRLFWSRTSGQDREQTEPHGEEKQQRKVCTFNPMNTLPPVDMHTSHRYQKPHHAILGLLSRGRPVHGRRGSSPSPGIGLGWTRAGADSTGTQILAQRQFLFLRNKDMWVRNSKRKQEHE